MQLGLRRSNSYGPRGEQDRAERLVAALDDGETACCVVNARGVVLVANRGLESFLGAEPGTIQGRSLTTMIEGLASRSERRCSNRCSGDSRTVSN